CVASFFSAATQFFSPSSRLSTALLGLSASTYLYPVKAITAGNPASAHASTAFVVEAITWSWYFALFSPRTNGAPGMPFGARAKAEADTASIRRRSMARMESPPLGKYEVRRTRYEKKTGRGGESHLHPVVLRPPSFVRRAYAQASASSASSRMMTSSWQGSS